MKNKTFNNLEPTKSKALCIFEYALLVFYMGIVILRILYTEGPTMQTSSISLMASDSLYSLYVSGSMLLPFIVWAVWNFSCKRFLYRVTGIEIGLLLFGAAAVISYFAAVDKRLAINNIVMLFTPVLCAILLVQVLDSNAKVKLVLAVIAALGIVSAYQCIDQTLFLNKETIKQYEDNPDLMLETLNIEKDSFQQFQLEQRLHSNNARAFFTTRNSAGTFFLMAILASIALLIESKKADFLKVFLALMILALFITKSKGAIISIFFSFGIICLYLKYNTKIKKYRISILILSLLLVIIGTSSIVFYGTKNQTLPGGTSMLVRWQYWNSSAQMATDHFWKGVGPGNFSYYYPQYKPAAAIESVSDPHNFPLSILTQFGILGLVGFLVMIFVPLWKTTKGDTLDIITNNKTEENSKLNNTSINIILFFIFGVVLSKITLSEAFQLGNIAVIIYIFLRLFLPSTIIFCASFYLIRKSASAEIDNEQNIIRRSTFAVIIFCSILGVLLHNLTDFAIFEPGIYTAFWFLIAALISANANNKDEHKNSSYNLVPSILPKFIRPVNAVLFGAIVLFAFLYGALLPVASSTKKIELANESFAYGELNQAKKFLDAAAEDDKLSANPRSLQARMFVSGAERTPFQEDTLLSLAEEYFKEAIKRNNVSYKNYEELSLAYLRHSEISPSDEKAGLLILALDAANKARERYEGNERLHFNYAQIADKLDMQEKALQGYEKAVEIEDQYRLQFKLMYPEKEIFSRLGEDKYQLAKKRISEITSENNNL